MYSRFLHGAHLRVSMGNLWGEGGGELEATSARVAALRNAVGPVAGRHASFLGDFVGRNVSFLGIIVGRNVSFLGILSRVAAVRQKLSDL